MPDFTNLDPSLVASFGIYFVGSFIVGTVVGAIAAKLFSIDIKRFLNRKSKDI